MEYKFVKLLEFASQLDKETFQVLITMMRKFGMTQPVGGGELAPHCGMSPDMVERLMKNLVEVNAIRESYQGKYLPFLGDAGQDAPWETVFEKGLTNEEVVLALLIMDAPAPTGISQKTIEDMFSIDDLEHKIDKLVDLKLIQRNSKTEYLGKPGMFVN